MKTPPEDVKLSREEGEALIARIQVSSLANDDQRLLVKLIRVYFWLTFALSETRISLTRLKRALFGGGKPPPSPPAGGGAAGDGSVAPVAGDATPMAAAPPAAPAPARPVRRQGHGRRGADAYPGATPVVCRHETLAAGQPCPACGRGTLYALPAGVEVRIDGNALLSAVRYEVEKLRCSACGEVFTADLPPTAGAAKYSPQARAVIALARYYLGLPFYRLEQYQALVGVPVADATPWDLAEGVADCAYPVVDYLWRLGAQGEVIFQDDTHVRILALVAENRRADAAGGRLKARDVHHGASGADRGARHLPVSVGSGARRR